MIPPPRPGPTLPLRAALVVGVNAADTQRNQGFPGPCLVAEKEEEPCGSPLEDLPACPYEDSLNHLLWSRLSPRFARLTCQACALILDPRRDREGIRLNPNIYGQAKIIGEGKTVYLFSEILNCAWSILEKSVTVRISSVTSALYKASS